MDSIKLQKYFTDCGIMSRRAAEKEIADGKVRVNGELAEPAIAETQTGEFSKTFLLKEAICPEAIRMEFHKDHIELYEFEIFKV